MSKLPNPVLPDDIVTDILLRLPVKPICRFKCVSKPWRSLLSNPQFARDHLKLHKHDPEDFILTSSVPDFSPYILTLADGSSGANSGVARKVQFLQSELKMKNAVVAGSCDGLILLQLRDAARSKILFNPITLETAKVLDDRDKISSRRTYGFGYDHSSEDYKVVCLSQKRNSSRSLADVYSVRTKRWKRIATLPYTLETSMYEKDGPPPPPGVYLNGCIHWSGMDARSGFDTLICYDLAREEFVEGLFAPRIHGRFEFEIGVLEGCLALVSEPYWHSGNVVYTSVDVWVMREYGVQDSWTLFTTISSPEEDTEMLEMLYFAVCVLNEDEIVFERNSDQFFAYNWRNEMTRDLVIDGIPRCFNRVMPFRGSLLSPN